MSETSNKNIDLRIQKTYALLSKTLLELLNAWDKAVRTDTKEEK